MKQRLITLLASLCACLVVACGWAAPPTPPADATPRLVSLSPAITETLGTLGATEQLVGRSTYCTEPAEIRSLPAFGTSLTPELEGLVGVRPTRILLQDHGGNPTPQLESIAPVSTFAWLSLEDVQASVRALGTLTDRADKAEALAQRLGTELAPAVGPSSPRVLVVIGGDGPAGEIFYVRSDSLHGTALLAAGGRNAIEAAPTGAPTLTAERVIALDPDVIIILHARDLTRVESEALVQAWGALAPVAAVRQGRVHVLDGAELMSVGPSILTLVPRLRQAIDPS